MTIDEIVKRLEAIWDNEEHSEADKMLCDALDILGGHNVVKAYLDAKVRAEFWYS